MPEVAWLIYISNLIRPTETVEDQGAWLDFASLSELHVGNVQFSAFFFDLHVGNCTADRGNILHNLIFRRQNGQFLNSFAWKKERHSCICNC